MKRHFAGHRLVPLLVMAVLIIGCSTRERPAKSDSGNRVQNTRQIAAVNWAILANHPHFTTGRPIETSLTSDALDFLMARPAADFPDLFDAAGPPIDIHRYRKQSGALSLDSWVEKQAEMSGTRPVEYFRLMTRIGLIYGFEGQVDDLFICVSDGQIQDYILVSRTDY